MKSTSLNTAIRSVLVFLVVLLGVAGLFLSQVSAQSPPPPRSDPPPDVPGGPPGRTGPPRGGGGSRGGSDGSGGGEYVFNPCMNVYGLVINWGYRNEPKVPVTFSGPGWQTQKWTDDNGHYASDCLGEGLALLNPVSPPWLQPMTADVAVRLGYRQAFEVNLGLYGGGIAPIPEIAPVMATNTTLVRPGDFITYTIQVTNTLSAGRTMGEVMVTDLLPEVLAPITATTSLGQVEWWGNLLTVDIGTLPSGQAATILATTRVRAEGLLLTEITNRASLLHTGHVATQSPLVKVNLAP